MFCPRVELNSTQLLASNQPNAAGNCLAWGFVSVPSRVRSIISTSKPSSKLLVIPSPTKYCTLALRSNQSRTHAADSVAPALTRTLIRDVRQPEEGAGSHESLSLQHPAPMPGVACAFFCISHCFLTLQLRVSDLVVIHLFPCPQLL